MTNRTLNPLQRVFVSLADWRRQFYNNGFAGPGDSPDDPDVPLSMTVELERFRQPVADLIVWLEMRGRPTDANVIDDALCQLREVADQYDGGYLSDFIDPKLEEPYGAGELFLAAVAKASSALEDLDEEIPEEVWQGFDDV